MDMMVPKDRPVLVQSQNGNWHQVQWKENDQNEYLDWVHSPHWEGAGDWWKPDTVWKAWAELPVMQAGAIMPIDPHTPVGPRQARQSRVLEWALKVLPEWEVRGHTQRAIRLSEETIELAQACNVDKEMLHKLVDYVYGRPIGEPKQELGGVSVCVLAVANSLGLDADAVEEEEVRRCEEMEPERFKARNAVKNAAGFKA